MAGAGNIPRPARIIDDMSTTATVGYSPTATPTPVDSVAIIGAGRVGTALARGLVEAGYDVRLAGSGAADRVAMLAQFTAPGARALTAAEAVDGADLVILAVPLHKIDTVDPGLLAGRIVVDVANYWEPIDGALPEFADAPLGTSHIVQRRFPAATIVKSLNHLGYHDVDTDRRPAGAEGRRAIAVASDDARAADAVAGVIDRLGFDPVVLESLAAGKALEGGGAVFGARLTRDQLEHAVAA